LSIKYGYKNEGGMLAGVNNVHVDRMRDLTLTINQSSTPDVNIGNNSANGFDEVGSTGIGVLS
jgi:hypothetical protein